MKIMVYEVREDEQAELARQAEKLGVSLEISGEVPTVENAGLAEGCQGVSILGQGKDRRTAAGGLVRSGRALSLHPDGGL
ncbi:hypothetical protein [Oscillibacter sp.]|uniref:hypothetical protein n=1 Tax=Oscillibacter sp. TaxID=1945593 RepID=UPI001B6D0601|nr:hypothetical protein [Oscillibacter sp.]MBP3509718.1 hypothetical protein [Oscillibacter sp.]